MNPFLNFTGARFEALKDHDVSNMPIGSRLPDSATGSDYQLTVSTAAVDHDAVESARNAPGLRWIKVGTGSGTVEAIVEGANVTVDDSNPALPVVTARQVPGQNPNIQYCSPAGDDAADGLTWSSAKKTLLAAGQYLAAREDTTYGHGGTIYYADTTRGNDNVIGQGLWMRGDGLAGFAGPGWTTASGPLAASWLPEMAISLIGVGNLNGPFTSRPAGSIYTGPVGSDRINAMIWVVACLGVPIHLKDVTPWNNTHNVPYRLGMDFRRIWSTGAIMWGNITNWVRTTSGTVDRDHPGSSAVTVTIPAAAIHAITAASRVGSTVTFTYPNEAGGSVLRHDLWFHLASTDVNFPSGDYLVTVASQGVSLTTVVYDDGGSATASGGAIGTWGTTGIKLGDLIETLTTDPEVPSCPYLVTSVTDATHFTVSDYCGYSPRTPSVTVSNPGQFVLQDRSVNTASCLWNLDNCNGNSAAAPVTDPFSNGPTIDIGTAAAGLLSYITDGCFGGMLATVCRDPNRATWLHWNGGSEGDPSGRVEGCRPASNGMRVYLGGGSANVYFDNVQGDIGVGDVAASVPQLDIVVGGASSPGIVYAKTVFTADADPTTPSVRISAPVGFYTILDCGNVIQVPSNHGDNDIRPVAPRSAWAAAVDSPAKLGWVTQWTDGRTTAKPPIGNRALGLLSGARAANLVSDASGDWALTDVTATAGQADPFGGTGATKLTGTDVGGKVVFYAADPTWAAGDHYAWGMWVRSPTGLINGEVTGYVARIFTDPLDSNGLVNQGIFTSPFLGDGDWQFISGGITLGAIDHPFAFLDLALYANNGKDVYVFQPTLIKIPAAAASANEFAEFVLTLRSQPTYLPPGMSGTAKGAKLVAHGGLGTGPSARYVVGVGSGQLTLGAATGAAVELFDEAGNSLGVVAPLSFTVNP